MDKDRNFYLLKQIGFSKREGYQKDTFELQIHE
jgi:hypothetical protein